MAAKRAILCAISSVALISATACSASDNTRSTLDDVGLEQRLSTLWEQQGDQKPDKVDCPDDLKAKEGTTTRCTLTTGGNQVTVKVTVNELDGTTVRFNAEVDE